MLAVQLTEWGRAPVLRQVPAPEPVGEELVLQVTAAGLCRSDLHVMDSAAASFDCPLPLTLGHEVAGTVLAAGPDAEPGWLGETVVVHGVWSCGHCRNCVRGRENYCLRLRPRATGAPPAPIGNGLGYHGGLAQAMLVPSARHLVRTAGLDPVVAAPLTDAGLTAYHAVHEHADLIDAHATCVVIGVGGLGHLGVQILRDMGAGRILAVDNRADARAMAVRLGAEAAYHDVDSLRAAVTDGADVIIDFAGAPDTAQPATRLLAPGGRLTVVGSAGALIEVGKTVGLAAGWRVTAPFWGPRADLVAVIDMARRGVLHVAATPYPLAEGAEIYRRLRAGDITGRAVLIPPPLQR
ncbi:NAD(P)-dependent alcohol dehydrogenase [Nocardia africana]